MDEEFLKHYKVEEIQNSGAGGGGSGINPLVDEEFLRHYQVEEIMAAAGQYNPTAAASAAAAAAAYGGGYYGYEYYMQGGPAGKLLIIMSAKYTLVIYLLWHVIYSWLFN